MFRVVVLFLIELAALAAMLALRIDVPWTEPALLVAMPEELVAAGMLQSAAIAVVAWLALSTITYAASVRVPRLRATVARVTAPFVRRVVDTALAATLSLGVASPVAAAEAPPEPIVVTVDEGTGGGVVVMPPGMAIPTPELPTPPPSVPTVTAPTPADPTARIVRKPAPVEAALFESQTSPVTVATRYEVRPGDHLWSIAEHILQERTARDAVPDHEVAPFWRDLIEHNRTTLRSGDPDLIYPGEILAIPEAST